jgi:dynein heavy chain 2
MRSKEEMEEFIASGKGLLDANAQTVEEIGNMRVEAKKIMTDFSGRMTQMRRQSAGLAKLLKQSGGSGAQVGGLSTTSIRLTFNLLLLLHALV